MKKKFESAVANIIAYTLFFTTLAITGIGITFPLIIATIKLFS